MEWHEIYAGLTQDPGRPEGERARVFAWLELEERIRRWAEHDSRTTAPLPVDELVSDTCEAVWRNLPAARGGATFAGFVFGQYRNQRRLRRSREPRLSRRPVDAEPRLPGGESALDEHAPAGANLEPAGEPCVLLLQLRSCLEQLPTRPRAAVKLRFLDGAPSPTGPE